MPTVITPERKPLFKRLENTPQIGKNSLFQNKKRLFIILGFLLFIALVVGLAIYFLNLNYTEQLTEKIA